MFLDLVREMLKAPWAKELNEENLVLVDKEYIIPAVIPIVLYNATREWNAPRYFKDIVNKSELLGDNIVNFNMHI